MTLSFLLDCFVSDVEIFSLPPHVSGMQGKLSGAQEVIYIFLT